MSKINLETNKTNAFLYPCTSTVIKFIKHVFLCQFNIEFCNSKHISLSQFWMFDHRFSQLQGALATFSKGFRKGLV